MHKLLEQYRSPPRNAEGGGSGGTAAPPAGGGGTPPAGAQGATPSGTGAEKPPAGSTPPAGAAAPPAGPYFPDGMPDDYRGKDERETLDKAWNALKGYREKDATRDVPKDAAGYLNLDGLKDFSLDESFKPYFDQLKDDKAAQGMFAAAAKHGIDRKAALSVWQEGIKSLKEAGMLEPVLDAAAERAALLPDAAKTLPKTDQDAAIDRRMQENYDFLDLMTQNRGLDKEAREYAELMLGDAAKGHKFLEWMRGAMQGGGAGPGAHGGGGGGADTAASLKAEMSKPELTPGHPAFDRAKYDAFDARYKAFHSR